MIRGELLAAVSALVACGFIGFEGCVAQERQPALPSAPAPSPADAGSRPLDAAADSGPEAGPRALELELLALKPPPQPAPHVEIMFPFVGQRIVIPKAATYPVRVKVEGWPLGAEGAGVEVALDGGRPRRILPGAKLELGMLVDREALTPGAHVLFAAARDADGTIVRSSGGSLASFAAVRFWIGDRDAAARLPGPALALFEPHGTYHGARAADGLVIDFLALPGRLGVEGGSAKVSVSAKGFRSAEQPLSSWQPVAIRGAPSGDLQVEVVLLGPDGKPLPGARASRTVTVNRESSPPKEP